MSAQSDINEYLRIMQQHMLQTSFSEHESFSARFLQPRREEVQFIDSPTFGWDELHLKNSPAPDEPTRFYRSKGAHVLGVRENSLIVTYFTEEWVPHREAIDELHMLAKCWQRRGGAWAKSAEQLLEDVAPAESVLGENARRAHSYTVPIADCRFYRYTQHHPINKQGVRVPLFILDDVDEAAEVAEGGFVPVPNRSMEWEAVRSQMGLLAGDAYTNAPITNLSAFDPQIHTVTQEEVEAAERMQLGWECTAYHFNPDTDSVFRNSPDLDKCEICGRPRPKG